MREQARLLTIDSVDIADIADVLAQALFYSPHWMYILPDTAQRKKHLPSFMKYGLIYGFNQGRVYGVGKTVIGASVWFPPGGSKDDLYGRLESSGILEMKETAGRDVFSRFLTSTEHVECIKAKLTVPDHYYLMILGVTPAMQNQNYGADLLKPLLENADRDGLPTIVDTSNTRNIPFYERNGFEVIHETILLNGPPVWIMMKHPD